MKSLGLLALTVVAAIGTGAYLSRKPWIDYGEQKKITRAATADMRAAEKERADYLRQTSIAERPSGREAIARERGYRRPNETPIDELK